MKTIAKSLLVLIASTVFFNIAEAQPLLKMKTHRVIRRTAVVIIAAHKKVKEGKVYTGNLARAVAHQKYARKLFRRGMYLRAIHHSRRARLLAILAIQANKGSADMAEAKNNAEEDELMKNPPADAELEAELLKEEPATTFKDEDVVNTEPDVDDKD